MLLPLALLPLFQALGFGGLSWLPPLLVLPWALKLVRRFCVETPGPVFNRLLAATAQFQLAYGLLLCLGLLGFH